MSRKRCLMLTLWGLCVVLSAAAQPPAGYYNILNGNQGPTIKTALKNIISNHVERSYSQLWTDFQTTDKRLDGKVWDMYSATTNYTFISDQCGSYKKEGDCYNREHSFPKSWFGGEVMPMYTDLFHLYPTDGKVNGVRGNYPFGEVKSATYTSNGSFSKLGPSAVSGYNGTVFEPNDEYKGDFARTYLYMVTCYEDKVPGWQSDMLSGNAYPAFSEWALNLLLKWHRQDPVSEKEINRNEAVYKIQKNRNPYIDYPALAEFVWGKYKTYTVTVSDLQLHSNDYQVSAIEEVEQPDSRMIIAIYDLTGHRVVNPNKGMYIVTYRTSKGELHTRKEVIH